MPCARALLALCASATLSAGPLRVEVDTQGLAAMQYTVGGDARAFDVAGDAFDVVVDGQHVGNGAFPREPTLVQDARDSVTLVYADPSDKSGALSGVNVTYRVQASPDAKHAWLTKTVTLTGSGQARIGVASPLSSLTVSSPSSSTPTPFVMHSHEGRGNVFGIRDVFASARFGGASAVPSHASEETGNRAPVLSHSCRARRAAAAAALSSGASTTAAPPPLSVVDVAAPTLSHSCRARRRAACGIAPSGASATAAGSPLSVVAVATNPFTQCNASLERASPRVAFAQAYNASFDVALPHALDAAAVGVVSLLPASAMLPYLPSESAHENERALVSAIADGMRDFPANTQVRVHVDWTEAAYQMDVSTDKGYAEYDRVLAACARLNVTHAVSSPRNGDLGTRANATDWWGWEEVLWLGFGEALRKGEWDPRTGPVPASTARVLDSAKRHGVKLLAYVYPIMGFLGPGGAKDPAPWVYCLSSRDCKGAAPSEARWAALGDPRFQAYLADTLSAFMERFGLGGFSFDYTFLAIDNGRYHSLYATWRGWMEVQRVLRARFPGIVVDHRQCNHAYGPFDWLYGSYSEPIMEDDAPETYGVRIADTSTDRIAASNLRYRAYELYGLYFAPQDTIAGFLGHLSSRYAPNGTLYFDEDANIRDFDLLGWEHSVLSSIAVAPRNVVVNMVPGRDAAEFDAFPSTPLGAFFGKWAAFAREHLGTLLRYRPLWPLFGNSPELGRVDGVASASADGGEVFVFLFNPSHAAVSFNLTWSGAWVDVPCPGSPASWTARELYPREFVAEAGVACGDVLPMTLDGTTARVLRFEAEAPRPRAGGAGGAAAVVGMPGTWEVRGDALAVTGASGEPGAPLAARALGVPKGSVRRATVNGAAVGLRWVSDDAAEVFGAWDGVRFGPAAPLGPPPPASYGGDPPLKGTAAVPSRVFRQLDARGGAYAIPWTAADADAAWLRPARLLVYVMPANAEWAGWANVTATLALAGGGAAPMEAAYNSRGHRVPQTFTGFVADVTESWRASADAPVDWLVSFAGPDLSPGGVAGVFFANVRAEYTARVAAAGGP